MLRPESVRTEKAQGESLQKGPSDKRILRWDPKVDGNEGGAGCVLREPSKAAHWHPPSAAVQRERVQFQKN